MVSSPASFPLRCCEPNDYLRWAFNNQAPPSDAVVSVAVPPYPIGLREFCDDCDEQWAKAEGHLCLLDDVRAGRLNAVMRSWLPTRVTVVGTLIRTLPPLKRNRPVEQVKLLDYLGKSWQDMLRVWAQAEGHDSEVVVFDLCCSLAAIGLFHTHLEASRMFFHMLVESSEFERVRGGVWRPLAG